MKNYNFLRRSASRVTKSGSNFWQAGGACTNFDRAICAAQTAQFQVIGSFQGQVDISSMCLLQANLVDDVGL